MADRRKTICGIVGVITLIGLAANAGADIALLPHSAEYKVKISVLGGNLSTRLQATEQGYIATHEIHATGMSKLLANGSIIESAEFSIAGHGLRPDRYYSDDTLTREKIKADIRFDWDAGAASGIVNGENLESDLDSLMFDRVSIQYQLMHDLLNGELGHEYTLYEVDEIKTAVVTNIGRKRVSVPAGDFDAVGIQHQSDNSKRVMTLWCVEELGYLPVIIEQHRKGKLRVRAELREYQPD